MAAAQQRTEAMFTDLFTKLTPIIKAATDAAAVPAVPQARGRGATPPPRAAPASATVPDFTTVRRQAASSSTADTREAEDKVVAQMLQEHKRRQIEEARRGFEKSEHRSFDPPLPRPSVADINPAAPRTLAPDLDARLRGGKQRLSTREAMLERLMTDSKNITDDERRALVELLEVGHQVHAPVSSAFSSPPGAFSSSPAQHAHPLSSVGMGVAMRGVQAQPALFQRLQENSLAPPGPGETAMLAAKKMFKLEGEKESKKAAAVKSYPEFVELMRKARVCTRDMHDADPDSYWAMQWHHQSVTHLHTNYGWAVANKYHTAIMQQWQEGRLQLAAYTETEECRSGDIEGALHLRNFLMATCGKGGEYQSTTKKTGYNNGLGSGSKTKDGPDWTWCAHCSCYFPPTSHHKTSSCRKKKAADKDGGPGGPKP